MVIVYTAILGDCDSLKPASDDAAYVCFTDRAEHMALEYEFSGWQFIYWPKESWQAENGRREAWRLRAVPHKTFNTYDTVIWVDASLTVTDLPRLLRDANGHELSALTHEKRHSCYDEGVAVVQNGQSDAADVSAQLSGYKREGFKPSALSISCILVRQHTQKVNAFNELWDAEIRKHPGDNTQLSLDYCAWKQGLSWHRLEGTRHDNPYAVHDAADHKRRRKPYR